MERALWTDKFAEQLDMVSADALMSQLLAGHRKAVHNMVTLGNCGLPVALSFPALIV